MEMCALLPYRCSGVARHKEEPLIPQIDGILSMFALYFASDRVNQWLKPGRRKRELIIKECGGTEMSFA